MKKIKITLLLLMLGVCIANAQEVSVSGVVTDFADNSTLPSVNVMVKGTTVGTITDLDGKFTLKVPDANATLVFSFIGYETQEIALNGQKSVSVAMALDVAGLEEVVVVGYGTQKKADLTGSVAIVDVAEMSKTSNTNMGTMLQGRVTGVNVTSDGQPGADPTIRIRGFSTFGDATPLYVIDGVAIEGNMRDLSPNDIETIQVLKDASAAAIYGSRAANGVIIITTKQGKKNSPLHVSYKGYFGIDDIWQKIPVLGRVDYQNMYNTSLINNGDDIRPGNDPDSEYYIDDVDTDWQAEGFKTGYRQNHNVSLMGGGETGTYSVILDYIDTKGTMVGYGPDYKRYSARANNTMEKGLFSAGTSLFYSHSDANTLSETDGVVAGGSSPMVVKLVSTIPTMSVTDENDQYGWGTYDPDIHGEDYSLNIIGYNSMVTNQTSVDRTLANGWGQIDIGDLFNWSNQGLKFKTLVSYDKTSVHTLSFIPEFSFSDFFTNATAYMKEYWKEYTRGLIENTLSYNATLGDLKADAVIGQTYSTYDYYYLYGYGEGFSTPYFMELRNAEETSADSYEEHIYMSSYLGRLNLDYKGRYLLSGSVRRDGSSKFSKENRFGVFPSVSAGWKIHDEEWFPVDDYLVSELKLRAGWGQLGNSTGSGAYDVISSLNRNMVYNFNGEVVYGTTEADVTSDLVWETKEMTNVGVDMGFIDHKVTASVEYFNSLTKDVIVEVDIPLSVGSVDASPTANAATLKNSGLEFNLGYKNSDHEFKYEVNANFSTLKNEVVKLNEQGQSYEYGYAINIEGEELAQQYGYVYEGILQSTDDINLVAPSNAKYDDTKHAYQSKKTEAGDILFKDLNEDGLINSSDRTTLGSGIPSYNYGINISCEWKGIDFSAFGNGAGGYYIYDNMYHGLMHSGGGTNWHEDILDAWTPENTNTDIPRVVYDDPNDNARASNRPGWLQKGDFFRISNITLGYTLPQAWVSKVKISSVRVYATVQNLHTFTQYKGYNPDFSQSSPFCAGFNYGSYPLARTYMFGLNFDF